MWSFEHLDQRPNKRGPCSSTSFTVLPQLPKRRTMEELWKDISLNASPSKLMIDQQGLYHHSHPADSCSSPFPNMILQDFLAAGPLNRPPYPPPAVVEELPLPPLQAALSLNSGLEFQFLGEPDQAKTHSNSSSNNVGGNATNGSFISSALSAGPGPPSPTAIFSFCSRKRSTERPGAAERCQHRMIKNRESAARSRARKQASLVLPTLSFEFIHRICVLRVTARLQAYTIELESEVSHLKEENAKLQRQNEELMKNQVAVTKSTLQRSSTAPF